jgi:secondary thiamine-phosphate synthase enzyme
VTRITVTTDDRLSVVDVTEEVRAAVDSLAADHDTVCTVFVDHTTAGVVVNEAEPRLLGDVESFLDSLVPDDGWDHDALDGNADSHLRALLLGNSATVPVVDGDLSLGRWQAVLLVDCDGPRERTLRVVVH